MSFVRDRLDGIGRSFRLTFFGILGAAFAIVALGCVAMAFWMLIQIFFLTVWLTIKAALYGIGAALAMALATGMFRLTKSSAPVRRPRPGVPSQEVLPPQANVHPLRKVN